MTENNIKTLPARKDIPQHLKWDVESVFADDAAWEAALTEAEQLLAQTAAFAGTLGESIDRLAAYMQTREQLLMALDKIFLYAQMKRDEDNTNPTYQALADRAQGLGVKISAAMSFEEPEFLTIGEERLQEWLQKPNLAVYRRFFDELLRQQTHIRNQAEEEILALAGEVCAAPRNIFGMFNNADIKFPTIENENGEQVEISHGNYIRLMESPSRRVRQDAFHGLYQSYAAAQNTLAAMLAANIKKNVFAARVRRHESSLAAALFGEEIPAAVYDSLIAGVRAHLPLFHRYLELRRQALGVDKLHLYDVYAPLALDAPKEIPYEEAVETVLAALAPLGEDYLAVARTAFTDGWVDVAENKGKTSGAYSSGVYGSKPFILLNYQGNLNSVFTLAHELGHSMHSYYSHKNQPYIYSDYEIFVAEVASTVNENLLLRYLLNKETDPAQRLLLVNHYLDDFRGTVFRQTMFAEFEKLTHAAAENGEALSCQFFRDAYYQLNLDYFGPDVAVDEDIDMEWSRIPHFYRAFYVYKYATGMSAATALAENILSGDKAKVDAYLGFLSGGCSQSPINLLRGAGVDMESPLTLNSAMKVFADMTDELEKLLAARN